MKGNLQCLDRSKILILPVYPSTIIPKRSIPLASPYISPFEQINKTNLLGLEQKKKRVVEATNTLSHLFAFSLSLFFKKSRRSSRNCICSERFARSARPIC